MSPSIVLVLGAGASVAMGYPVGATLRTLLIDEAPAKYLPRIMASTNGIYADHVSSFANAFKHSQMYSIDAFLARRPEYVEVGRRAIAAILLDRENVEPLSTCTHLDRWYQYFFNRIASERWDDLDFGRYGIVTFNYDRSLEHYLVSAMSASYNRSTDECHEKLAQLRVVHIYGALGALTPSESNYFRYGSGPTPENIAAAAAGLRVIPEGRHSDQTLEIARAMLVNADRIAFLGFGFDQINLARLDSVNTCKASVLRPTGNYIRDVIGTCLGMTKAESLEAMHSTKGGHGQHPILENFSASDCLTLLRETLALR